MWSLPRIFCLFAAIASIKGDEVSFKNVQVKWIFQETVQTTTVASSTNLKDNVPGDVANLVAIVVSGSVPILYENAFDGLVHVQNISLSSVGLQEIQPGAFGNLPQLYLLDLSANSLTHIQDGVFNNLNLVFVRFTGNKISSIEPTAFDNMPRISILYINNNQLSEWNSNWLSNAPKMAVIYADHNAITYIPSKAFGNYPKMEIIDLQANIIDNIDVNAFEGVEYIETLRFRTNKINEWNVSLLAKVKIGELDLSRNSLVCIEDLDQAFKTVKRVVLVENPWSPVCASKVEQFINTKRVL